MLSTFIFLPTEIGEIEFECFYTIENDDLEYNHFQRFENNYKELQSFEVYKELKQAHKFVKENYDFIFNQLSNELQTKR